MMNGKIENKKEICTVIIVRVNIMCGCVPEITGLLYERKNGSGIAFFFLFLGLMLKCIYLVP
jgi:hypothetical protein